MLKLFQSLFGASDEPAKKEEGVCELIAPSQPVRRRHLPGIPVYRAPQHAQWLSAGGLERRVGMD